MVPASFCRSQQVIQNTYRTWQSDSTECVVSPVGPTGSVVSLSEIHLIGAGGTGDY